MSLFRPTAFYVTMLEESIYDIGAFMLMLIICLVSFTNAIMIVDVNQQKIFEYNNAKSGEDYSSFIDEKFSSQFMNVIFSQYLLGLGEFEVDELDSEGNEIYNVFGEYTNDVNNLLWIYFLFATLLTQIILMNTLIAILG